MMDTELSDRTLGEYCSESCMCALLERVGTQWWLHVHALRALCTVSCSYQWYSKVLRAEMLKKRKLQGSSPSVWVASSWDRWCVHKCGGLGGWCKKKGQIVFPRCWGGKSDSCQGFEVLATAWLSHLNSRGWKHYMCSRDTPYDWGKSYPGMRKALWKPSWQYIHGVERRNDGQGQQTDKDCGRERGRGRVWLSSQQNSLRTVFSEHSRPFVIHDTVNGPAWHLSCSTGLSTLMRVVPDLKSSVGG